MVTLDTFILYDIHTSFNDTLNLVWERLDNNMFLVHSECKNESYNSGEVTLPYIDELENVKPWLEWILSQDEKNIVIDSENDKCLILKIRIPFTSTFEIKLFPSPLDSIESLQKRLEISNKTIELLLKKQCPLKKIYKHTRECVTSTTIYKQVYPFFNNVKTRIGHILRL